MSIFSTITGFARAAKEWTKKAYSSVTGTDVVQNNAQNSKTSNDVSTPAVKGKSEKVGDKYIKKDRFGREKETDSALIQKQINDTQNSINKKIKKNQIKKSEIIFALNKILQISGQKNTLQEIEELSKLNPEEQLAMIKSIDTAIDLIVETKSKYNISKDADFKKVFTKEAEDIYEFMKSTEKTDIDAKQIRKKSGDINKAYGKNMSAKTAKEQQKVAADERKAWKAKRNAARNEILKNTPKNLLKQVLAEFDEETIYLEKHRYNEVLAVQDSDTALNITQELAPQALSYKEAASRILETRSCAAEATRVADKQGVEFFGSMKQRYQQFGCSVSPDEVRNAAACSAACKSEAGLNSFNDEVVNARREGKKQNGSYPEGLNDEDLQNMHAGTAVGAMANQNLSSDAKTKFMKKWNEDACSFGEKDYQKVKSLVDKGVQEYIQQHPEMKSHVEEVKKEFEKAAKQVMQIAEGAEKEVKKETEKTEEQLRNTNKKSFNANTDKVSNPLSTPGYKQSHGAESVKIIANGNSSGVTGCNTKTEAAPAINIVHTPEQIETDLTTMKYTEVCERHSQEDILKTCMKKQGLYNYLVSNFSNKIRNTKDADYLNYMMIGCTSEARNLVYRTVSPDVASKLYDKQENKMGFDDKLNFKKYKQKDEKNAVC